MGVMVCLLGAVTSVFAKPQKITPLPGKALKKRLKKYKADFAKPGNIQEKQNIIAEYLGLKDPE